MDTRRFAHLVQNRALSPFGGVSSHRKVSLKRRLVCGCRDKRANQNEIFLITSFLGCFWEWTEAAVFLQSVASKGLVKVPFKSSSKANKFIIKYSVMGK
jgi:hypothetical protein